VFGSKLGGNFGVTDFGLAFGSTRRTRFNFDTAEPRREAFIEGGVMRNVDSHDAVGVTWFVAVDNDAGSTGPGARYRRWLTKRQSLDAGVGIPVASSDYDAGTLFGLIRYSPNQLVGLTVRPERIRRTRFECVDRTCGPQPDNYFRVLVGGDLSGKAGAVVTAWYGVAAGVMMVVLILTLGGHH
jgi:hypothetical protein